MRQKLVHYCPVANLDACADDDSRKPSYGQQAKERPPDVVRQAIIVNAKQGT